MAGLSISLYLGYLIGSLILFVSALVLLDGIKTKRSISKGLRMSVLQILMPSDSIAGSSSDYMYQLEPIFSYFVELELTGWNKFLYGDPYISLEMFLEKGETAFYVAVPENYERIFEKQIKGIYPNIRLSKIKDPHIIGLDNQQVGRCFNLSKGDWLPINIDRKFEFGIFGEVSKFFQNQVEDNDKALIQILLRRHKGLKVKHSALRDLSNGIHGPKASQDIRNKCEGVLFETNFRLFVSSGSLSRADTIADSLSSSIVEVLSGGHNSLNVKKIKRGKIKEEMIRIFDNSEVIILSGREICNAYHLPVSHSLPGKVDFDKHLHESF